MTTTKNLNETVNEILNKEVSRYQKQRELIKFGLTNFEVNNILNGAFTLTRFDFSSLTFGVEIECYNFTRDMLIDNAVRKGLYVRSEGYNHEDKHYFKIVRDGSLTGENTQEVVSPILKGDKGLNSLQILCSALSEVNAKVNVSCGLHIHIGAANMKDAHYIRIVRNYQKIEKVIDTFMPESRRGNNSRWRRSLQDKDFAFCTTKRDVRCAMSFDRYFKVNAEAYDRHRTIEFRQHSGTTDYVKISNWILFLAKLVEYSLKHEITTCCCIEEIPFLTDEQKQYFINRREALN